MADPLHRLVQQLSRLPGVGEKTATRLAFHLIGAPRQQALDLARSIVDVIEKITFCSICMNVTEDDPCALCHDGGRDGGLLCVVATPADVVAIDRGGHFRGRYHVLHGVLSPLDGIGPEDLKIYELLQRIKTDGTAREASSTATTLGVREVIVATSANVEGEATAAYIAQLIKPLGVVVSRIASGLPVGGELEYADQATIARAMDARSPL